LPVALLLLAWDSGAAGDPNRGEEIYSRCGACHSLDRHRTGPKHCGLFGRKAGTATGFDYSRAMRRSGILWNEETLDAFLADPLRVVPGTAMGYAGVADAQERADLIAYLRQANGSRQLCP
jgi:cytochrome c